MKRSAPPQRRTPLKADPERVKAWQDGSRASLVRTGELPPVNAERRKRLDVEQYGAKAVWIRSLPCYVTGFGPCVAAHVKSRGAGGKSAHLVPFHPLVEIDWHQCPEAVFEAKYGVSKSRCKEAAEEYEQRFRIAVKKPDDTTVHP